MVSKSFTAVTIALIFLLQNYPVQAGSFQDLENLHKKLFASYEKGVIPYEDTSKSLEVNFTFGILNIQDFDEVNGKFSVVGYLYAVWKDPRLMWDPNDYNQTVTLRVHQSKVWVPPITLTNPYEEIDVIGKEFLTVYFTSEGVVYWVPGDVISVSCIADVTYFPFDEQFCAIVFNCWGISASEIRLRSTFNKILMDFYYEHGTWEISETDVSTDDYGDFSSVTAMVQLKRRPAFVITNIIVPVLCVLALDILVFIVPVECGERVSFSITVLLSLAVFLTIVGDSLPKTSDPMSIISFFLLVAMIISCISCFMTVICIHIYYISAEKEVPGCIQGLVRLCTCNKSKKKEIYSVELNVNNSVPGTDKNHDDEKGRQLQPDLTWQEVSYFVDKIMIAFNSFALVTIIVAFYIFTALKK